MSRVRLLGLCLCLTLLLLAGAARAATPLTQFNSWAGKVNYTGTVATMRTSDNDTAPCSVVAPTKDLTATVSGIPAGATILYARLYWAASGTTPDDRVNFQGAEVVADHTYTTGTDVAGYNYFSGAVDVTAQVKAKAKDGNYGNGTYHFSGLAVDTSDLYCSRQGVLGGFSLLIVYSHTSEPFRVMNLYEGFQYVHNSGVTLTLSNFRMPATLDKTSALLGHITWEGDDSLYGDNEYLLFNGYEMTDKVNKSGNQFNSASTVNGDTNSYGIDFDVYDVNNKGKTKPLVAGSTSVTTTYQTGDDLVLLSAEIVAVPNVATADLRLVMSRADDLQVGVKATYTLSVSNAGPSQEDGPVTVTDTLPNGFYAPVGSGSGWSCATSGQTVQCTWPGALPAGTSLPPITISALLTAPGTYTNSANVSGTEFDNVPGNNTASDTGTAIAHTLGVYVFTDTACKPGVAFGTAGQCNKFAGPVVAGSPVKINVTTVDSSGNPMALSTTTSQNRSLNFALSCKDPVADAGVFASWGGTPMGLCAPNGQAPASGSSSWLAKSLTFAANAPSVEFLFQYDDVGRVILNLADSSGNSATTTFTVIPHRLAIVSANRVRDGAPNPGTTDPSAVGFAMAGEPFALAVQACKFSNASDCLATPNFGRESAPQAVKVVSANSDDNFASVDFTAAVVKGKYSATGFTYDEIGAVQLVPKLVSGSYFEVAADQTIDQATTPSTVGRFYPAYFTTTATPAFICSDRMKCPADLSSTGDVLMSGAVYSGQPFKVTVKALSYLGSELANYTGTYLQQHQIALAAFAKPGVATLPSAGSLGDANAVLIGSPDTDGKLARTPAYTLPNPFTNTSPRALNWSAPTPIYVRATAPENTVNVQGQSTAITVTSKDQGFEAGVMVLSGRLLLANAFGSELLKLPVGVTAQYWTGSGWETNTVDNSSQIKVAATFSQCKNRLNTGASGVANCKPALAVIPASSFKLANGTGKLWLQAPGTGNTGSGYMDITNNGNDPALPSTVGRVTFGIYKSPLIYIREVY